MELQLHRHDLLQTTSAARCTLAVLPLGDKKTQKVAVGDLTGVLQCFSIKKGDIAVAFKTLPTQAKVTALCLGRGRSQRDRIFSAADNVVRGHTRKGKEFFRFNTHLTEPVRRLAVHDTDLWTATEHVHNHWRGGEGRGTYVAPDIINDMEVLPLLGPENLVPALACADKFIRVLSGGQLMFEIACSSAPTCLRYVADSHDHGRRYPGAKELLYGTAAGTLVQLFLDGQTAKQGFVVPNTSKAGAITAIFSAVDYSKTGTSDVVVGRDDGSVEVYDISESGQPQLVFRTRLGESVVGLEGGYVTSPSLADLLVHTFSGKVISFSPPGGGLLLADKPASGKQAGQASSEASDMARLYRARIAKMQQELSELEGEVERERQKHAAKSDALISLDATAALSHKLVLDAQDGCHVLSIESAVPIYNVALQSTCTLELQDLPASVAILSRCAPDEQNGNLTLATYRCQEQTRRLDVRFRAQEGKGGTVQAFVIPNSQAHSCAPISYRIKPLSLHQRVQGVDPNRPCSTLTISGSFSLPEIHCWLSGCLDGLPPHLPPTANSASFSFNNVAYQCQLQIRYRAGEAVLVADALPPLALLHECVMGEATTAKQRVGCSFSISPQALEASLSALWPQLQRALALDRKAKLLEALQELRVSEPDLSFLSPEYQDVLAAADQQQQEQAQGQRQALAAAAAAGGRESGVQQPDEAQQHKVQQLCTSIKELFSDYCRLAGLGSAKQRLPGLEQLLRDAKTDMQQVLAYMLGSASA